MPVKPVKLEDIIRNKRDEVKLEKRSESIKQLQAKIAELSATRDFLGSISKNGIRIIAETKIKSPTSQMLVRDRSMLDLAKEYEQNGISAISVLTDEKYFGGSKEDMEAVKNSTTKPILRKDFIIDEYQVYQSRAYGADAILLISCALDESQIKSFVELSRELGMECLVEFSDESSLNKIPALVKIYGRNYRTIRFKTPLISEDIHKVPSYIDKIPDSAVKVAESCIGKPEDMKYLRDLGFDAFLIGEALSGADDTRTTVKTFLSHTENAT